MIDKESFLMKLNPVTKLAIMVISTVLVSFSYDIYTPVVFFILLYVSSVLLGNIHFAVLLRKMVKFIIIGMSFGMFIVVSHLVTDGFVKQETLIIGISLWLRVMVFSLTSVVFVITTDPNDFGISMIHQLKIPYKVVYPFLIAYRFIPTFQDELDKIILAKEMRGVSHKSGFLAGILNMPGYILPLLTSAIRKGERVSMSMESRAFGIYEDRTYYNMTKMSKADYICIISFIAISLVVVIIGLMCKFINFKLTGF